MMVLFLLLRGIYTYPLKKTATAIGAISLVVTLIFTIVVIAVNINDVQEAGDISFPGDEKFNPFVYRSVNAIIISAFLGIVHSIVSALVIYGALKEKRFFLVPYIIKTCVSILLNIYNLIACLIGTDYHRYYLIYLAILLIQIQFTISIFRHFQELTEGKSTVSGIDSRSELPYDKMTNSVA